MGLLSIWVGLLMDSLMFCWCEWSGVSNCDVILFRDVYGIRRCFFFLSLLRGGMIMVSSVRWFFGISGSSSIGGVSGSFSGVFIQLPLTCIQSIFFFAFFSLIVLWGKVRINFAHFFFLSCGVLYPYAFSFCPFLARRVHVFFFSYFFIRLCLLLDQCLFFVCMDGGYGPEGSRVLPSLLILFSFFPSFSMNIWLAFLVFLHPYWQLYVEIGSGDQASGMILCVGEASQFLHTLVHFHCRVPCNMHIVSLWEG